MQEQLERYLTLKKFHHFEGQRGVDRLETVIKEVCDYGTLRNFLEDNPGCIEAMLQWVSEQRVRTWESNLVEFVGEDEDESN